jgi:hypothetical protein
MDGAIVFCGGRFVVGWQLFGGFRRPLERLVHFRCGGDYCLFGAGSLIHRSQAAAALGELTSGRRSLAPLWRDLRLFVFVVRIAGGAAGLFHLVINHRHDGVIRDAALTRAIVVENVTEPRPALLHQNSLGAASFGWDRKKGRRSPECSKTLSRLPTGRNCRSAVSS